MTITHLDEKGQAQMVDIQKKVSTKRTACAEGRVIFPESVYQTLMESHGKTAKGSIVDVAKVAGIMAAKNTSNLIPMCHPLMLERCNLYFNYENLSHSIVIEAEVAITHKTGVEMEALTAVTVAALTLYDMTKALSHDIRIEGVRLLKKTGGKSDYLNHQSSLSESNSGTLCIDETQKIRVDVLYFAELQSICQKEKETISVYQGETVSLLYDRLEQQYHFNQKKDHLRVAVNHSMSEWNYILKEGDIVAFITPISGG